MTFLSLFYTLNKLFAGERCPKSVKKVKSFEIELSIFKKNIAKCVKTLKFTKSPQQMLKVFASIKEEFGKILAYNNNIDLEFDGERINSMEDLYKIDIIQDKYIKEFLNNQINIELEKVKLVESIFLKEKFIKCAIMYAMKSVEFLPKDGEMLCKINELENKLLGCYNEIN